MATYKVILNGLAPNATEKEVIKALMVSFKISETDALNLVKNPGSSVKKGLDLQTAAK